MLRSMMVVGVTATLVACASTETARFGRGSAAYAHDVVTFEELSRTKESASNLYQALERIRPSFIHPRSAGRPAGSVASQIDVFVNGGYAGDGNVLLTLHPAHVASIRMERRSQAFVRHGAWLRGDNVLYITLLR